MEVVRSALGAGCWVLGAGRSALGVQMFDVRLLVFCIGIRRSTFDIRPFGVRYSNIPKGRIID